MSLFCLGAAAQQKTGLDRASLDESVRPADDFFQWSCGGWMKSHPLPAAYSRYGSFDKLGEDGAKRLNTILTKLQKGKFAAGTTERKLSDLYKLAMDSVRRDKEGAAPLMPVITRLEQAKTMADLWRHADEIAARGDFGMYGAGFGADEKDAKHNILSVSQGGLVLAQKEYYLASDSATAAIREAYKQHIVKMFAHFGFSEAQAKAKMQRIMRVETQIAMVSKSMTELRDPEANYHKTTLRAFTADYPNLRLPELAKAAGMPEKYTVDIVVGQPEFLLGINAIMAYITVDELRDYFEWNEIQSYANYLSADIVAEKFDFFGRIKAGRKTNLPLWQRATSQVENQMGEALGKLYAEKYFPKSSKERMEKLVRNLQTALGERIDAQQWMSDSTKANAHAKLDAFYVKIGYPDKWTDMSALAIDPSLSYTDNIKASQAFWHKHNIERKAGKDVDKDEWFMYPQTVNAYYNPTTNEICFPAGILQKPFFDPEADDAFNYGAIGVVIGHEMTHGFDDQGRRYDLNGNMRGWWTDSDAEQFNKLADSYADFFSSIEVLPGLNANGRFTLGENLADHGGLQVAFTAFKNATKNAPLKTKDGLTPQQRFFLAYSGVWAGNITDKEIRNRTKSDPHSLSRWRVNGALPHIDAWYEAFNVKPTDKMWLDPAKRLRLW